MEKGWIEKKKKEKGNEKKRREKKEKKWIEYKEKQKTKTKRAATKKILTNPFVHVSRLHLFSPFVGMWGKKASTTTIRLDK